MSAVELSLVLPCFNEASHLRASARAIAAVLAQAPYAHELLFVDDGSTDGTRELLPELCRELPDARFVLHEHNRGRGAAFKTGFRATTGRVTGYIDVDLEVPPDCIAPVVRAIVDDRADIATGKRRYDLRQTGSLHRVALSHGYRVLSRALLGVRTEDTETGYKFFRRETAGDVIARSECDGWFFDTEVMVRAERAGLTIREVPVPFVRRHDKQSSVRLARDVGHYLIELGRLRRQLG